MTKEKLPELQEEKKEQTAIALRTQNTSIFLDIQRFEEAQRIATLLSSSTLVPTHFQKSIANCVIALNLADRLCVDPFMLMQNMYVVHGRPGIEGKLAIALIEGTKRFSSLKFKFEGNGKTEKGILRANSCIAYATELNTGETIEGPPVTWDMAVVEGWTKNKGSEISKWQTLPDLMFRYRSAMFFARVNCPGALLGLRTLDEIEDTEALPMYKTPQGDYQMKIDGDPAKFDELIPENIDKELLDKYLVVCAEHMQTDVTAVKISAGNDIENFLDRFSKWSKAQQQRKEINDAEKKATIKKAKTEEQKDKAKENPSSFVACPNNGDLMQVEFCNEQCTSRKRCPAFNESESLELTPEQCHQVAETLKTSLATIKSMGHYKNWENKHKAEIAEIKRVEPEVYADLKKEIEDKVATLAG